MARTYLQGVQNKCRCGATASGIKEETVNAKGNVLHRKIVASNCKECKLKYVADDYHIQLTPSFQKTIQSVSKTNL